MISAYDIFSIQNDKQFETQCLDIFRHQAKNNAVYRNFLQLRKCDPQTVSKIEQIPFLPVEVFKNMHIQTGDSQAQKTFTSSGTTGSITSQHPVHDLQLYEHSFSKAFELFYGDIQQYALLALLPAYLERDGSSLVYMAQKLIEQSRNEASGFYLYNYDELHNTILQLESKQQKYILLGVSFALLDYAERYPQKLNYGTIMETGGMKGRRREMVREELHSFLQKQLHVSAIHSEYGMTELLSQAYSKGDGQYLCPPWMKIMIRDSYDPYSYQSVGQSGCINIIDLANYHSCSFLETSDIGRINANGSFEVMGRIDNSDVRGCNLMVL